MDKKLKIAIGVIAVLSVSVVSTLYYYKYSYEQIDFELNNIITDDTEYLCPHQ